MQPTQNLTRDNHYVQQALIRRWSQDENNVCAYRTLVSHTSVKEWELKSIKVLAEQRNLYTVFLNGRETDEFEHRIEAEFETPGIKATEKVVNGETVASAGYEAIGRSVAVQDLRTPSSYLEEKARLEREFPSLAARFKETCQQLPSANAGSKPARTSASDDFSRSLKVRLHKGEVEENTSVVAELAVSDGRSSWLSSIERKLHTHTKLISEHQWSVLEPYGNEEWPLTDQPVVRLNYYETGRYDFGGGWGNPNTEIMMPISPRHLLYVKVGNTPSPDRYPLSEELTHSFQRFLVERAYRLVMARKQWDWVRRYKPRRVDPALFTAEQKMWAQWHENQLRIEKTW